MRSEDIDVCQHYARLSIYLSFCVKRLSIPSFTFRFLSERNVVSEFRPVTSKLVFNVNRS